MRMSDLTSCEVRTADGRCLGRVRDLVLVMDGPLRGTHAAMRVEAVLVGGSSVAVRLGYERGGVRGPAPLSTVLRRLERRAHVVPVADIEHWDLEHRVLRVRGDAAVSD